MINFILHRRLMTLVLTLLAAVIGVVSWMRLPIDAFPDATNQQVMIMTEAEGLGPLDVEQQITIPIETVMGGLPHLKMVRSMSKSAFSQVVVIFEDHVDTYFARQLVFERLQMAVEALPSGVQPELGPISTGLGEVLQYTLESKEHSLTELRTLQDWLVTPRLRSIAGVNEVNSFGGKVRQVEVRVDPDRLLKYNLSLNDVSEALESDNANAGGAFIVRDWEQQNLRSLGLFGSLDDIRDVVLQAENGTPVSIADIADVVESNMSRFGAVSRDGKGEAVAGMVIMLKGENSKEVVERVKAVLPSIEKALPKGVTLDVFYDRTELVASVINTVSGALMQGGFFVVLILFLFLGNLRSALVVALSLPMTALSVFILMDAAQLTANLMTLGGLAIAVGMVVDGSIVVTENVVRRLRENGGADSLKTVYEGTTEVARPIVFSILIIVLVFVPLFTLEGMEGKMFIPLATTMIFAMLSSLLVSLSIVPVALSYLSRNSGSDRESGLVIRLRDVYMCVLKAVLRHPSITGIVSFCLLAAALAGIPFIGMEFLPELDEGAVAVNVVRLPNAALEGSIATADFMEKQLLKFPEVLTVVSKTGRAEISEDPMGPEQTDLLIMLHPESEWQNGRSKEELLDAMRETLEHIPGLRLAFSQPIALRVNELISGVKSDLAVKVFGYDIELLKEKADGIAAAIRTVPGAGDVNVEQITGFSQLEIVPDRREMARYGLNMATVNELVETAIGGKTVTELVDNGMRFGIRIRFPEEKRNSREAILNLLITSPDGARIPLGRIAEIRQVEGPAQISRENNMRRVVVEANVRNRDLGSFVKDVREELSSLSASLPPGYWIEYGGTFESQQRAMRRLGVVVPISVLLILLMLISALKSFHDAAMVLVNLPFALVGGLLSMLAFGITLNVPATVGFIALFGVAVQNGTMLLSFIGQLRRGGMGVYEAVTEAARLRFRALLMTAATTVLGLVPMIYATGPGAETQRPLALVVIGGLISATALTLLVLPSIYIWLNRKSEA